MSRTLQALELAFQIIVWDLSRLLQLDFCHLKRVHAQLLTNLQSIKMQFCASWRTRKQSGYSLESADLGLKCSVGSCLQYWDLTAKYGLPRCQRDIGGLFRENGHGACTRSKQHSKFSQRRCGYFGGNQRLVNVPAVQLQCYSLWRKGCLHIWIALHTDC